VEPIRDWLDLTAGTISLGGITHGGGAVLAIRLLGEIEVVRDGSVQPLPPSKKTRALLAYLALTGRPHRRERLCSLLWDIPHDPRGALRWSLSRLRPLVDEPDRPRIMADRETVGFTPGDAEIDVILVREALRAGVDTLDTATLESLAARFRGELLEGQDLPDLHDFQAWCVAEREDARRLQAQVLTALVERLGDEPEAALGHARQLVQIDPYALPARLSQLRLLVKAGRRGEAEQQVETGLRLLREADGDTAALSAEWRRLQARPSVPDDGDPAPAPPARAPMPAAPLPLQATPPPPALAPHPSLIGRMAERQALLAALAQATAGKVRVVLVAGEPGLGKSTLIETFLEATTATGGAVLTGHASEAERDQPFAPWQEALASLDLGFTGGTGSAELGRHDDRRLAREQLYAGVIEQLSALAREHPPLILVLEDIHWLDEASAALLAQVVRGLRHLPLLVLLTARDGELPDNPPILGLLRGLRHDRLLDEIELLPLGPAETALLAGRIAPGVDGRRVAAESGGNPLLAQELAQALGAGLEGVPRTLQALVRDRIERLPSLAAEILQTAAVLGPSFHIDCLERLLHLDQVVVVDALEVLERHALLRPGNAPASFDFRHELIHRAVYSGLSEPRRRLLHLKIAQLMRAQEPLDEAVASELAQHAALAGDDRLAAEACISAGHRCLRLLAGTEAEILARRSQRHAERLKEPDRTRFMIDSWRVLLAARPPDSPEAIIGELEQLAERAVDFGLTEHARRCFRMLSLLRWERGLSSEAERDSLRGEILTRAGDDWQRILGLTEAARCLTLLERDPGQAEALVLEAQAMAQRQDIEPDGIADTLGMLRLQQGELDEAARLFERAREGARRDGERSNEFMALEHLTKLEIRRGNCVRARQLAAELTSLAERLRAGSELPFARLVEALCRQAEGAVKGDDAADAALAAALEALVAADAKQRLAFALNEAACLDHRAGRAARAGARAAEALRLATLLELPSEQAIAHVRLTRLALEAGDRAAADRHAKALGALLSANISAHARALAEAVLAELPAAAA
jgi:DNA-binding SARP family transcriptional activator